jgi:PAS domain S-box-containing protein
MSEPNLSDENGFSDKPDRPGQDDFLIVGLGASAGGIQALKEFFGQVPADSGVAYVVILHLSPDHDSQLAGILQAVSAVPVTQVTEKVLVEPNHVYVVPPDRHLEMMDGHILVSPNTTVEERRAPVDIFFRTLAESHGARAVAVVLSGTGANGSMGLKRVKERGGVAFVQNPREAEFNEMPRNSIATDLVDGVLPVAEIPARIIGYKNSLGTVEIPVEAEERPEDQQQALREVFTQLRLRTGHDFSNYKRPTLLRRVERRINVRSLPGLQAYAAFCREHAEETQSLLKDLLISVTNFFRDQKAFEAVERDILPRIFHNKGAEDPVRIWVAGCATGEEAYSIAILCAERALGVADAPKIQIFASDIDEAAIATAREGLYTLNDAADVSPERLRRFFTREGEAFRVRREIREMILFAQHNVLKDPPFSHLDLVSCRNLLIYLNHAAQERVMETLHFALNPGGYLFLGSSESVNGAGDLFATASREHHIFQSRQAAARTYPVPETVPAFRFEKTRASEEAAEGGKRARTRDTYGDLHQRLLEQYAPPSVVVTEDYDIVHVSERAGRFLQVAGGEPSNNLLKLVRPELRLELRTALYQATQRRTNVEARNLKVRADDRTEAVTLHVRPVLSDSDTARGFLLVLFEPGDERAGDEERVPTSAEPVARQLEEELVRLKGQVRASNEQHELQAEELKASNEELQAMNEELRSTAEELETSKEELQSINEELRTVNQELKVKVEETTIAGNNLQNLINSTDMGTIFLDRGLRVNLFTPAACQIFNLLPADVGRQLSDITHRLEHNSLLADAEAVLEKLQTVEREVQTTDGRVFLMRVLPYRTAEDRIQGVVITFTDLAERVRAEAAVRQSEEQFRRAIEEAPIPVIMHAEDGEVLQISRTWTELTGYTLKDTPTFDAWLTRAYGEGADAVRAHMQGLFEGDRRTLNVEFPVRTRDGELRHWSFSASSPGKLRDNRRFIVGMADDITERKLAEADLAATTFLRDAAARLAAEENIQRLYKEVLFAAITIVRADAGMVQILDEETQDLLLLASQGFDRAMTEHFRRVSANSGTPWGVALRKKEQAFVNIDAPESADPDGSLRMHVEAGYRSVLSKPLVSLSGKPIGLVSAHWREPHHLPSQRELRYLDLLSHLAADLIERRQTEKALRQSEERLRLLLENLPGGAAFIVDRDLRYLLAEGEALYAAGFRPQDLVGKTIFEALPAELAATYEPLFRRALAGETFAHEHEAHGGSYVSRGTPLRSADGEVYAVLAVSYDISERKRMEERLRASEERLRLTVESVTDYAIFTLDIDGRINSWNVGAERMFGYTGEEALGQHAEIIFTPEDRAAGVPTAEMRQAREAGRASDERWHVRRDGTRFFVSGVSAPLREGGKLTGYVKIARDLTRQKQAEEELVRAHGELEGRVQERTRELREMNLSLTKEIAERVTAQERARALLRRLVTVQEDERRRIARDLHDHLGQQLTALQLNLASHRESCGGDAERGREIEQIEALARAIDAEVDFLAWELRPAALDTLGLATALENFVRQWSDHTGVEAEFHAAGLKDAGLPPAAEINLYRIAQEALNNISKHAAARRVSVILERRDGLTTLVVEDDGRGFTTDGQTVPRADGGGLGLIGMQERAALVGGKFDIESSPGKGTTVYASVPDAPPEGGLPA